MNVNCWKFLLMSNLPTLVVFIFVILHPAFSQQFDYTDKLFGKRHVYTPKTSEISVKFLPGTNKSEMENIARQYQLSFQYNIIYPLRFCVYNLPEGTSYDSIRKQLIQSKLVSSIIPTFFNRDGNTVYLDPEWFIVQFIDNISRAEAKVIINSLGSTIVQDYWTPGYYAVTIPPGETLFEAISKFMALTELKFAQPFFYGFDNLTDDTYLPDAWHLRNTAQVPGYTVGNDIKAFPSWDITFGDEDIIITIIDTGIDLTHPDLVSNFLPRGNEDWDFTEPGLVEPVDELGHGTAVAGVAAAAMNTIGVRGGAPACKIMPLKAFNEFGAYTTPWLVDAINYAVSRKNDFTGMVINCSWIIADDIPDVHNAITNAVNNNDIPMFFTTGNNNNPFVRYPGRYPETIAVGAMAPCNDERKNPASCDGENWGSNYGPEIDIAAPGVRIYTTDIQGLGGYNRPGIAEDLADRDYTKLFGGTSSAAPMVAGTAALMLSINSNLSEPEIRAILHETADKVGSYNYNWNSSNPGHSQELGHGRINAYEALKEAFPIKITGDIDTSTTWVSGDYALIQDDDNNPATPREYYVDNEAILTIESGAVMVVEAGVRLIAIDGSQININPGALICLEPGAEIIAGPGNTHVNVGSMNICFYGTGSCLSTTGGVLKFTSGITFTVNNRGVIAAFESQGGSPSTIEIEDNVSLVFQSNSKLLLEPGALIKLGDNVEITSDGEIDVQGTGTNSITFTSLYQNPQTSQYWKWLKLDGSQDTDPPPQRIFDYTTIEYADYGIHATQVSNLAIENSTIQNCRVNNIYLYSSYSYIDNNYISNSGISNGIYLYNSSPLFYNTTINDNTGAGVFCYNYSSPEFGASTSTAYGANVLTGNVYGVSAVYYSNPFLGDEYDIEGPARYGGYNSIYDNSSAAVQALQRCDIIAQYNWWGNYPVEPEIFDIEEDCSIDYDHALTYDPNQESSAIIAGGSVSEQSGFSSLPTENFTPRQLLKLAKKLRVQRLPRLALPVYKQLILNYPNRVEAQWGLLELISTFKEAGRDSAVAYLLQTIASHPNLQMQRVAFDMLTGEYLGKKNANAALSNAQQILGKYPNTESEKIALFNLVNIYFHNLNDPALAQIYFSQLEIKYPNDELTFQAQMLLSGSGVLAKPSNKIRIPFRKPGDKKDGPDLTSKPATFSLSQNYPNPFNPNTTIEFSLPDNQQVDISIFSVNGQRIITLVNGFLEKGYHTIQWDSKDERGTPIASGIYIIRLKAGDKWYARKMMLLK